MRRALLVALFPVIFSLPLVTSLLWDPDVRALLMGRELSAPAANRANLGVRLSLSFLVAGVLGHAIGHLMRFAKPLRGKRVTLDHLSDRRFAQMHVVAALAAWLSMPLAVAVLFILSPLLQRLADVLVFLVPLFGPIVSTYVVITRFVRLKVFAPESRVVTQ